MTFSHNHLISDVFFAELDDARSILGLFDHLPDVSLFVKNAEHRFVKVNRNFLSRHGLQNEDEAIGKCDFDFHPPAMAEQYVAEDKKVMQSRNAIVDEVWLVLRHDGMPVWYLSTKLPMLNRQGEVIGLAGILKPHDRANQPHGPYGRLGKVCNFVLENYGSQITVESMAEQIDISISQLQREFATYFRMSPRDYLAKVRLSMAQHQLLHSDKSLGRIAIECGYYDQSHFNRIFRKATGQTPREFQNQFESGLTGGQT
jgi:PAS domain S-box-containing protein